MGNEVLVHRVHIQSLKDKLDKGEVESLLVELQSFTKCYLNKERIHKCPKKKKISQYQKVPRDKLIRLLEVKDLALHDCEQSLVRAVEVNDKIHDILQRFRGLLDASIE